MSDVSTFDAADAAFRSIHEALAGTLTSAEVAALIAEASTHIAGCDLLAGAKMAVASDATVPTRDALAAKQEGEGLTFVADRLRGLMPTLDRRRATEADAEEQGWKRDAHLKAQDRVAEIVAKVRKEYPKAVAALMGLVDEIQRADAIALDANKELPRDAADVPKVEKLLGAEILSRLHLPDLSGAIVHEMSAKANEDFRNELWNREQREASKVWERANSHAYGHKPLQIVSAG